MDEIRHDALAYIQQLEQKVDNLLEGQELADFLGDKVKQLEAQVPRWISVEERLPECIAPSYERDMSKAVLLYTPKDGRIYIGWYAKEDWRGRKVWFIATAMTGRQTLTKKVTHWMPLPEAPEEDDHA